MRKPAFRQQVAGDSRQSIAPKHAPVMLAEVLDLLQCVPGGVWIDATVGLGGHAEAILERIRPGGTLIGIDRDRESLEQCRHRLMAQAEGVRLLLFQENFKNLPLILNNIAVGPVDGMLVDLGVSSYQLLSHQKIAQKLNYKQDRLRPDL